MRPPWTGPVLYSLARNRTPSMASIAPSTRFCTSASESASLGTTSLTPSFALKSFSSHTPSVSLSKHAGVPNYFHFGLEAGQLGLHEEEGAKPALIVRG